MFRSGTDLIRQSGVLEEHPRERDSGTAGLFRHSERVFRRCNVAVSENRNFAQPDRFRKTFQSARDRTVVLRNGPEMENDELRSLHGFEQKRNFRLVISRAELDAERRFRVQRLPHGTDNLSDAVRCAKERSARTVACDGWTWAREVQIDRTDSEAFEGDRAFRERVRFASDDLHHQRNPRFPERLQAFAQNSGGGD